MEINPAAYEIYPLSHGEIEANFHLPSDMYCMMASHNDASGRNRDHGGCTTNDRIITHA
jgi:hypothetical protein